MSDRLRTAIEATIAGFLPFIANYVRWRYRVVSVSPGPPVLISGVPVSTSCPHGQLANIVLWRGPSGSYAIPIVGSQILVEFLEGNPQYPVVSGQDPKTAPQLVTLGATGPFIARVGDHVTISPAQFAAASPIAAGATPGTVTITAPMQATIATGSTKVESA